MMTLGAIRGQENAFASPAGTVKRAQDHARPTLSDWAVETSALARTMLTAIPSTAPASVCPVLIQTTHFSPCALCPVRSIIVFFGFSPPPFLLCFIYLFFTHPYLLMISINNGKYQQHRLHR